MRWPSRTVVLLLLVGMCALSAGWSLLWRGTHAPLPSMRLEVLNGSGTAGLGLRSAERLRALGQDIVRVADADRQDYARTVLLDRRGRRRFSARLAKELGGIPVLLEALENTDVDITVILGADARRLLLTESL